MGSYYGVDDTGLISTSSGIVLPSTGGTKTTLDYCGVEFIRFAMSGSYMPSVNFFVTFSRVGQSVTMSWQGFTTSVTNTGQQLTSTTSVPSRFLPTYSNSPVYPVYVIDGNSITSSITLGTLAFGAGGKLVVAAVNLGSFNNSYAGILDGSISYIITSDL